MRESERSFQTQHETRRLLRKTASLSGRGEGLWNDSWTEEKTFTARPVSHVRKKNAGSTGWPYYAPCAVLSGDRDLSTLVGTKFETKCSEEPPDPTVIEYDDIVYPKGEQIVMLKDQSKEILSGYGSP